MDKLIMQMANVREYAEGYPVELVRDEDSGRLCVRAINEGGQLGFELHQVKHDNDLSRPTGAVRSTAFCGDKNGTVPLEWPCFTAARNIVARELASLARVPFARRLTGGKT